MGESFVCLDVVKFRLKYESHVQFTFSCLLIEMSLSKIEPALKEVLKETSEKEFKKLQKKTLMGLQQFHTLITYKDSFTKPLCRWVKCFELFFHKCEPSDETVDNVLDVAKSKKWFVPLKIFGFDFLPAGEDKYHGERLFMSSEKPILMVKCMRCRDRLYTFCLFVDVSRKNGQVKGKLALTPPLDEIVNSTWFLELQLIAVEHNLTKEKPLCVHIKKFVRFFNSRSPTGATLEDVMSEIGLLRKTWFHPKRVFPVDSSLWNEEQYKRLEKPLSRAVAVYRCNTCGDLAITFGWNHDGSVYDPAEVMVGLKDLMFSDS